MKTTLRIAIAGALVGLTTGVPWALHHRAQFELGSRREVLRQQAGRWSLLIEENERLSNRLARAQTSASLTGNQLLELLRLRNERQRLVETTNRAGGFWDKIAAASPAEIHRALSVEMSEAMKCILPGLPSALQRYTLAHSNLPPDRLSSLEGYFPLVDGRQLAGLNTFEFVREDGPRPGDALLLRVDEPGEGEHTRIYGYGSGQIVEVTSEDDRFDDWEAQHFNSPPAGVEGKVFLEYESAVRDRAHLTDLAASVGISAQDASRFWDQAKQREKAMAQRLAEREKTLTGSAKEKQQELRAFAQEELIHLATETLGDKGPALVRKLVGD